MISTDKDLKDKHFGPLIATCIGIVLVVGGFAVWQARPLYKWAQAQRAVQQVDDINELIEQGKFVRAHELALELYRLAPQEPEVIRACGRLAMGMHSPEARFFFEKLIEWDEATFEDRRDLLTTNLHLGDTERANALSAELLRENPHDLQLLRLVVAMKMSEEEPREAMTVLAEIIKLQPEDSKHRFLLARLLILHGTPAERQRGWEFMWTVAHSKGEFGIQALNTLLSADGLAEKLHPELIELVEGHPLAGERHYVAALGLRAGLDPGSRTELINSAMAKRRDWELARQVPFFSWLNREREHAFILRNLTYESSKEEQDILIIYLNALGHEGHWDEVRDYLADPSLPISEARQLMFSALCSQKLGEDESVVEGYLQKSLRTATLHGSFVEAFNTGAFAEAAGLLELAEMAYGLAQRSPSTTERAYEALLKLARQQRDAPKLRKITARMHYRYPRRSEIMERFLYLNALVGVEVESTLDKSLAMIEAEPFRNMPRVIAGLAYYRMSDFSSASKTTESCDPQDLTDSQKAVCAAIAAAASRPEDARQLASDVPTEGLLSEEQRLISASQSL